MDFDIEVRADSQREGCAEVLDFFPLNECSGVAISKSKATHKPIYVGFGVDAFVPFRCVAEIDKAVVFVEHDRALLFG